MINSNEQCRKSADSSTEEILTKNVTLKLKDEDIGSVLSEILSGFNERIGSILIVIESDIYTPILQSVLNNFNDKKTAIFLVDETKKNITLDDYKSIFDNIFFGKYKKSFVAYDKSNHDDYSFFGTTKAKIPILLHKSFIDSELILPICNLKNHKLYIVKTAKMLTAYGLISDKADMKLSDIDSATDYDRVATDICLIARSDVEYFALNYFIDNDARIAFINTGDLMISHIESSRYLLDI